MTPVTDPTVISQLEGSGGQSLGTPVNDPTVISQLEAPPAPGTNPSFLPRVGADVLAGVAQMGNGLINAPHNLISSSIPSYLPNYNYSQALGVNNPNILDKGAQGIAQYAPYMLGGEAALGVDAVKALQGVPALLARTGVQAGTGATFGATQSQNPGAGAAIGAAFGAGGELIPAGIGAGKNIAGNWLGAIKPQAHAESLLNILGGGNSLEENSKSLAVSLQNAFNQKKQAASALYQPVFDSAGDSNIYNVIDPANSAYQNLNPASSTGMYGPNLQDLHQNFLTNPTFNNAHDLRSQLSSSIRQLSKNPAPDAATTNTIQAYQQAKGAISNDMNNFLSASNPELANQYQAANNFYADNVAPYKENSAIAKIATGGITNPRNITNIFKNPEPDTQQIVEDMGPNTTNNILYSQLGKTQSNLTPEKLMSAYNQLQNQGLGSYVNPTTEQQFESLAGKITARNFTQKGAGIVFGGLLGNHFGIPHAETAGAIAGGAFAPYLVKGAQSLSSLKLPYGGNLAQALQASYRPALSATAANLINSQGGQ